MIQIMPISAFSDNYIWLIANQDTRQCVLVDPADGEAAWQQTQAQGLTISAILLTHYHLDHMGGVAFLQQQHDTNIPVYGPLWQDTPIGKKAPTKQPVKENFIAVKEATVITIEAINLTLTVHCVAGHTLEHINYQCLIDGQHHVFCGDSLFSAGCGRVFEGTMQQMLNSMKHYRALPDDTWLYPAHEYTQNNLAFAYKVEPDNQDIQLTIRQVAKLRQQGLPSLPVQLSNEKKVNPFLRWDQAEVQQAVQIQRATPDSDALSVFSGLRIWKDAS
ncbi:hydroxyacylglutathione hydrolase [Motilimonas cestriensis]|uniref:Hydroxyacylglutathione hydrolase n=1 Tax=Motilimonas cestriensis TaxID=2742685 RepID=A0ABS8WG87_9GAMM|nr:hydroxyacylglutathione hydrolase [Motilimonas cestriensis]MCE2596781.1 hydroxyacylglutathione hydrolase [Motilimonas cestriensis]